MAKSVAERQREYRARRSKSDGDRRLNTWISSKADSALENLADQFGVTKREMIERLALSAAGEYPQSKSE